MEKAHKRECGNCTKCCEGWLAGEALGHTFYGGKPCHFISIGNGCTVYAKRPKEPCVSYQCAWLKNEDIPEWFKPNLINTIIDYHTIENHNYIRITEAGQTLQANVLTWLIQHALKNNLNMTWTINGGLNYIGNVEFIKAMQTHLQPKEKSAHLK